MNMVEPSAEEQMPQEPDRSTADYADYEKPQKPRNPMWGKLGRKVGIGLAVLVLVIALGGGGYWFIKIRGAEPKPASSPQSAQQPNDAASQITTETKKFESANFKLSFDYPGNWTASEDNPEEISVLSRGIKMKDADGKDVTGQVYFRVRAKGQKLQGFDKGDATAVIASEKIAYTTPSQVQRASTYISFLRYADNSAGLDAIYITGDLGYEEGQTIPKADIEKVDPIISIEFYLCPNSGCMELSGVYGIGVETWSNEDIKLALENMLKSLTIN